MRSEVLLPHIEHYLRLFFTINELNITDGPTIDNYEGNFLQFLLSLYNSQSALEIGCGEGYSTKYIVEKIKGKLIAIDNNKKRIEVAKKRLKDFTNIEFFYDDAENYLKKTREKFDFVFVDSIKSRYSIIWHLLKKHLKVGALVIFDDILMYGLLGQDSSIIPIKYRNMCDALDSFIKEIAESKVYPFFLVPIGNGLLLVKNVC